MTRSGILVGSLLLAALVVWGGASQVEETNATSTVPEAPQDGLMCPSPEREVGHIDFSSDARGSDDPPVKIVRRLLDDNLQAEDQLRAAGVTAVAVVRDGERIAFVYLTEAPRGGLIVDGWRACSGLLPIL